METPVKDRQTVTADGTPVGPAIEGVVVRRQMPIEDDRGEVIEVYRSEWGVHPDPLVYIYQVSIRVGMVKGWVVHQKQDDRLFVIRGATRWVLYDQRKESPTHGVVQQVVLSERSRALLVIPRGVFHAVENIGETEAVFINTPTRAYDHEDPDKLRLPLANNVIPFQFRQSRTGG